MSANEMDFTATERAALDRFTVPAMRSGFAADMVSAATAGARVPPRRTGRVGWRAHGRVLIGAGALVLASATAAATGWFGKLPIAIPGITRTVEEPAGKKPKHVVRVEKPKPTVGRAEALAAPPEAAPTLSPDPAPLDRWRAQRQARIAAGLPINRPLVRRALMARFRAMPVSQRQAAVAEWRRIRALPPPERKAEIAKLKADYLATHPRVAAQVERRLEAKSALAASAGDPVKPDAALPGSVIESGTAMANRLTPQERFERRQARRQWWLQRRAMRSQSGQPSPSNAPDEGQGAPDR
ncbi:hypothetical protein [Sphingomonas pruni]|uniref:hypothetical protein n=1 Tax=Sphingomonas pruni TaxID=40683 RepID=UPI00082A91E2|nr:hypothetical protein [Sphingomonas pruni]